MAFHKATKKQSKARIAVMGPAGAGKTYTALQILTLLGVKKLAGIDTERGSMSKYSHKFQFDVEDSMVDFSIRNYIAAIAEAAKGGYDGLAVDSLTHAWAGKGGALEQVDSMGGSKFSNGWKTVSPLQAKLVDTILTYPGHVVCTMRSKIEYMLEQVDGKAVPKRAGTKPIQRDDIEYEFDFVLDIQHGGAISILKTRDGENLPVGHWGGYADIPRFVQLVQKWLSEGAPVPAPAPVVTG